MSIVSTAERSYANGKRIAISGGFDPIHIGHINMIRDARQHGEVVVFLNSDEWLQRKKGYVFQNWHDRASILAEIKGVAAVFSVDDSDGTVLQALKQHKPDYFANGGDRTPENTPEMVFCLDNGIKPLWGIGGGKIAGSQTLVENARQYETMGIKI